MANELHVWQGRSCWARVAQREGEGWGCDGKWAAQSKDGMVGKWMPLVRG
jgi:hypothetical protein